MPLIKEELESIGWEAKGTMGKYFECGLWTLELRSWVYRDQRPDIIFLSPKYRMGNYDSFHGACPDLDTLKILMKLLDIKP